MAAEHGPGPGDKAVLRPPGQPFETTADVAPRHRWLWGALALSLLLAMAVVFVLPDLFAPHQALAPPSTSVASPPPDDGEAARDRAHRGLQAYLQLRARLELEGAAAWGDPGWEAAATRAAAADRHFSQRRFEAGAREYRAAAQRLQQLAADRASRLARATEQGERALAEGDAEGAIAHFDAALRIQADHLQAARGRDAAHRRADSIAAIARGRSAEAQGDLESAQRAYGRATQRDPGHVAARTALERVTAQIERRAFLDAMSRALAALDSGRIAEANTALIEAGRLRPDDPAVRDTRQRLQARQTRAALTGLRAQAANATQREDWTAAAALYRKALSVDATAGFAQTGLRRAEDRVRLHAQFDHYLDAPARLYADAPRANAGQLLASVGDAPPGEPRLARKVAALRELVTRAETPMPLTLQSDGETDIVIYRVGALGRFEHRELELRPGNYTIVGRRAGYRDVRRVIELRPGKPPPTLVVRCEEAI